ncbi:dihydropteroate synthase [Candidatus Bipolaricaulota bacterium]|nr:dihydropteroate synthase [Candidatus Bipolaricaulota bacterium]
MGILNVTADSFYDGGRYGAFDLAVERAVQMIEEGADVIDVGGESTRPGSLPIPAQQEIDRVVPVIEALRGDFSTAISIDTTKATVAREALAAGASVINDVSALRFDADMPALIAKSGAFVVLMHMLGTPGTMQKNPVYEDAVAAIRSFLAERIAAANEAGIPADRIIIDPGIGFGKTLAHNLAILRDVHRFAELGPPVLIGLSRKSFLGAMIDAAADERLAGTIAANAVAVRNGADILRVHDVKEGRQAAAVAMRLRTNDA